MIVYRSANWWFNGKSSASWYLVTVYCTPWRITLPSTWRLLSAWGGPGNQWNFNEVPIHQKIIKMVSQDPQNHKNEVPRGTQSHQNNKHSEKVKSNENINIYNTVEGLGHQNSAEVLFKNHRKACLQSKCDCWPFKSEKIWKSDPEWPPMGDPKSTKITGNQFWSLLSAPLHPMITKILKKWCPKTQNAWKMIPQDLENQ